MMKFLYLLFLALLFSSCNDGASTDQELLQRDKIELDKALESDKIRYYKFCKILLRASVPHENTTAEHIEFVKDFQEIITLLTKYDEDFKPDLSVMDYIRLYRDYRKISGYIDRTDEDIFPTVIEALDYHDRDSTSIKQELLVGEEKIVAQNSEHAILSVLTILSKDLGKEISLYECAKTNPKELPDSEIKTLIQFFRGFIFFEKGLYYVSENEISSNINWLNNNKDIDLELTKIVFSWGHLSKEQNLIAFRSMNHLFRGFDRSMMDREIDEQRALQDFEAFIYDMKELGIENEIVWAVESYFYVKNEQNVKAIESLKKLKNSSLLSNAERSQIDESIAYLNNRDPKDTMMNGVYDNYFIGKIGTKYMISVLSKVDWKKVLKDNNVKHADEIFNSIDRFKELSDEFEKYGSTENIEKAGEDLKNKGKSLWNKAKELAE